jgi:hypothetical protein
LIGGRTLDIEPLVNPHGPGGVSVASDDLMSALSAIADFIDAEIA